MKINYTFEIDAVSAFQMLCKTLYMQCVLDENSDYCYRNGKIYATDILECDLEDNLDPGAKWRGIVVWGTFGWMCKGRQCIPMDEFDILEGEVIGNIFDNSLEE